jgi:hypothetical protein
MKSKRRAFIKTAMLAGSAVSVIPMGFSCTGSKPKYYWPDYSELDEGRSTAGIKERTFFFTRNNRKN